MKDRMLGAKDIQDLGGQREAGAKKTNEMQRVGAQERQEVWGSGKAGGRGPRICKR